MNSPATVQRYDIASLMSEIRELGPSWKTDCVLICHCYNEWRRWSAEARDVWGHMHTPVFYASTPEKALIGVRDFISGKMLADGTQGGGSPYVDDDGRAYDCEPEVYLDQEKVNP